MWEKLRPEQKAQPESYDPRRWMPEKERAELEALEAQWKASLADIRDELTSSPEEAMYLGRRGPETRAADKDDDDEGE